MEARTRRQSVRAVLGVIAAAAILVSMRSIYQEMRHRDEVERARAVDEATRPADWQKQVERARKSVQGQLEAFKKGDWDKGFTYAAASFHEQMHVKDFRQMVESGYPQIARPKAIHLGRGDWHAGLVAVEVTITGKDGGTGRYLYSLAAEDGEWKVAGVSGEPGASPVPPPGGPSEPSNTPRSPQMPGGTT
jgi:hypothetical protein